MVNTWLVDIRSVNLLINVDIHSYQYPRFINALMVGYSITSNDQCSEIS